MFTKFDVKFYICEPIATNMGAEWECEQCCFWLPPGQVQADLYMADKNNYCRASDCGRLIKKQGIYLPYVADFFCQCERRQASLGDFA